MIHEFDVYDAQEPSEPGWDAPVWFTVSIVGLTLAILALAVLAVVLRSRGSPTRSGSGPPMMEAAPTPRSIGRA